MMRRVVLVTALLALAASESVAQTSVYSVLGLGYPGRPISVRTRAMGGGLAALDPGSALNPGAVAAYRGLTTSVTLTTSFREYTVADTAVSGLQDTRLAYASLGGPVTGTPLSFDLTFATYLDRTFDVVDTGRVEIRGDTVLYVENISSDGAVIDLRGAVGWEINPKFRVGAAFHILSGTTENIFRRDFEGDEYAPFRRADRVSFSGVGGSAGIMYLPQPYLRFGASVRINSDVNVKLTEDVTFGKTPLPTEVSGGVFFAPIPTIRFASTAIWRSWSKSGEGFVLSDVATAYDTWEIGSGVEVQGPKNLPLRFGFRYAQLPFSSAEQAREINLSFGSGVAFAQGRGAIEFAIERGDRSGGGAKEKVWMLSFELRVVP